MPELPEVETVRRQLEPELVGKRIVVRVGPRRAPDAAGAAAARWSARSPAGRSTAVARRGKYLLVGLEGGRTLAMHLRMTGNLLLRDSELGETADLMKSERLGGPRLYEAAPEPSHVRARFELDDGRTLRVHRRAPLRAGRRARRRRPARRVLRLPPRRRAALRRAHAGAAARAGQGPQGAAQVVPADPVAGRRHREHLRRRGALAGEAAPALAGRLDEARARRARWSRGSSGRSRRDSTTAGRASTTTATPAGSAARCRTSSWSTRARASHCSPRRRRSDPANRRHRPLDLLLPGLPGAAAEAAQAKGEAAGA